MQYGVGGGSQGQDFGCLDLSSGSVLTTLATSSNPSEPQCLRVETGMDDGSDLMRSGEDEARERG